MRSNYPACLRIKSVNTRNSFLKGFFKSKVWFDTTDTTENMKFGTALRQWLREIGVSAQRVPKVVREMKRKGMCSESVCVFGFEQPDVVS
jgi:hypothetical protein